MENNILLIDDDEDECVLLEMMLKHCAKQAKIHQVLRFEQAVSFAETFSPTPDLIFLDLRFPEVSGMEILVWIRNHNRLGAIPVVVWSHTASEDDMEMGRLRGSSYFLSKTADPPEMKASVTYICDTWLR